MATAKTNAKGKAKVQGKPAKPPKPPLKPGQVRCECGWVGARAELDELADEHSCPKCGVHEQFLEVGPKLPASTGGVVLDRRVEVEIEEPLDQHEAKAAREEALDAREELERAQLEVQRCKREVHDAVPEELRERLKEAKEIEEQKRALWDERAMRLARNRKRATTFCKSVVEPDGFTRLYDIYTGEMIEERRATPDELKRLRQPALPYDEDDAPAKPAKPKRAAAAADSLIATVGNVTVRVVSDPSEFNPRPQNDASAAEPGQLPGPLGASPPAA